MSKSKIFQYNSQKSQLTNKKSQQNNKNQSQNYTMNHIIHHIISNEHSLYKNFVQQIIRIYQPYTREHTQIKHTNQTILDDSQKDFITFLKHLLKQTIAHLIQYTKQNLQNWKSVNIKQIGLFTVWLPINQNKSQTTKTNINKYQYRQNIINPIKILFQLSNVYKSAKLIHININNQKLLTTKSTHKQVFPSQQSYYHFIANKLHIDQSIVRQRIFKLIQTAIKNLLELGKDICINLQVCQLFISTKHGFQCKFDKRFTNKISEHYRKHKNPQFEQLSFQLKQTIQKRRLLVQHRDHSNEMMQKKQVFLNDLKQNIQYLSVQKGQLTKGQSKYSKHDKNNNLRNYLEQCSHKQKQLNKLYQKLIY